MTNANYEVIALASVVVKATSEGLQIVLLCCGSTSAATVKIRVQGWRRQPLEEVESKLSMAPLPPESKRGGFASLARPMEALGNQQLYYARAVMTIPQSVRHWSRLAIDVTARDEVSAELQQFCVERSKRSWGLTAQFSGVGYAFLLTDQQIEERVNWLASNYGLACTHLEERVDALSNMFLQLRGGFDTPLIAKDLDDEETC